MPKIRVEFTAEVPSHAAEGMTPQQFADLTKAQLAEGELSFNDLFDDFGLMDTFSVKVIL